MSASSAEVLGALFERFRVQAKTFHAGPLCGLSHYDAAKGYGFLHVLRSGQMEVWHEPMMGAAQRTLLTEPTLIFYPRPWTHGFVNPPEQGSELICATLRYIGGDEHPLVRALPAVLLVPLTELQALNATLGLLFAEAENAARGDHALADRLVEVLLLQLLRWLLDRPSQFPMPVGLLAGLTHPRLSRSLIAMCGNPAQDWSLDNLAQLAGMSRSAFAEAFREVVGETAIEHLARWRINLAKQLLARGKPVKCIAQDVGYGSASALSRAFTARVGQSPREWQQLALAGSSAARR